MPRTLVVTPTYNEKDNLVRFVDAVRGALPEADILVVDDGSPDGTGELADGLAAKDGHIRVLHRAGKQGLGTAYVQAFTRGLAEGYDRFFEMDADLSHDVRYLPDFVRALEAIALQEVRSNGYSFQIEMTYRAVLHGMRVKEVPIVFVDRTAGRSKISRRIFVEAIGMVWKLRYSAMRGRL